MLKKSKALLLTLAVGLAFGAVASVADVIDRIAAVVNEEIILLSEVDEKVFLLQAQGQLQARDSVEVAAVRREVLNRLVEERLVVQRAKSQGIEVDEVEITQGVNKALENVRSQFPDEASFEQALEAEGITLNMLRERYEKDLRQERMSQRIVGREIRSEVEVTTEDVQKYFDENQDTLPTKAQEVHLAHLVVEPIDKAKEKAAREKLAKIAAGLKSKDDFDAAAKENVGGKLGQLCRGDLAPSVEAVLDTLEVGGFSAPTRSLNGFHIFYMAEREGTCFTVEHILIPITVSEDDVKMARAKAQKAYDEIAAGADFASIVTKYTDDELTVETGGDLGWAPVASLLPDVAASLEGLEINGISEVIQSDRGFHVFKLLERREGGAYEFAEVRDQLQRYLEQLELEKVYDVWMNGLRDSAYVEIKAWTR
ncbi:MAG: hypothetical protein HKN21_10385 [Candidatus Eisenbacteria bacterium]|uniref:PpiC domain-containing protein n=1 Tax=Eiseniibacteriota bacterium TaxID=2212470 RepID=A0A7Y2EA90_UNCEI|nr:hypothetical protein [Candidatus Eisenbacteria bacterium]